MLEYIGVDYEDKRLKTLDEWDQIKHSLGLDFPNVPYYIEGWPAYEMCPNCAGGGTPVTLWRLQVP